MITTNAGMIITMVKTEDVMMIMIMTEAREDMTGVNGEIQWMIAITTVGVAHHPHLITHVNSAAGSMDPVHPGVVMVMKEMNIGVHLIHMAHQAIWDHVVHHPAVDHHLPGHGAA